MCGVSFTANLRYNWEYRVVAKRIFIGLVTNFCERPVQNKFCLQYFCDHGGFMVSALDTTGASGPGLNPARVIVLRSCTSLYPGIY